MGKMQTLTIPNADEDVEQQKLLIVGGTVTERMLGSFLQS